MSRLVLAWLFRRPVQALAILGVAVGLAALLLVQAVMNGLIETNEAAVRAFSGDLHLVPAVGETPPRWDDYAAALADVAEVEAAAPHLVAHALSSFPGWTMELSQTGYSDAQQVRLVGVDPEAEARVNRFGEALARAEVAPVADPSRPFAVPPGPFARPGLLVSDDFARGVPLAPGEDLHGGKKVELAALPWRLPPPGERLVPVNGVFTIAGTYAPLDFRTALDVVFLERTGPNGLHWNLLGSEAADFTEALLKLAPGVSAEAGKAAVLDALSRAGLPRPGGAAGGELVTWRERNATFLQAIHTERRMTTLVLSFVVLVAAFGLFAVLAALVREKVRDLGVLAACGAGPWTRGGLVFGLGALASALGAVLGFGVARWLVAEKDAVAAFLDRRFGIQIFPAQLYVVDGLPAVWDGGGAVRLALATFLLGLLFTLMPALRAARTDPVEALRYE